MRKRLLITIDGPSGTGKSTAARNLSRKLGYLYLDTGAMYRAVALKAAQRKIALDDTGALKRLAARCRITFRRGPGGSHRVFLNGREVTRAIRLPEVSEAASRVATVPGVRQALVRQQRALGRRGGVVAEGRDAGTVVFPRAELKFYLTAGLAERARRRHAELRAAGHRMSSREVLRQVRARDRRDRGRAVAPLRPAAGAIRVDNTRLQARQLVAILLAYVRGAEKRDAGFHRRTL